MLIEYWSVEYRGWDIEDRLECKLKWRRNLLGWYYILRCRGPNLKDRLELLLLHFKWLFPFLLAVTLCAQELILQKNSGQILLFCRISNVTYLKIHIWNLYHASAPKQCVCRILLSDNFLAKLKVRWTIWDIINHVKFKFSFHISRN